VNAPGSCFRMAGTDPEVLNSLRVSSSLPRSSPSAPFAHKRRRQAEWEKYCDDNHLSVEERNRAASIIRPGASIKVITWPSLRLNDYDRFTPADLSQVIDTIQVLPDWTNVVLVGD
jgi:hypothetical protein